MFLDLIPVLNVFIILAAMLLLGRTISKNFRSEREYSKAREDRFAEMIEESNVVLVKIFEIETLLIDHQTAIVEMIVDLNKFVNDQKENFNTLAKIDMFMARREELLRTKELKVALERLMGVALTSRQPPAPNDVLALKNLTQRIDDLEEILKETTYGGKT